MSAETRAAILKRMADLVERAHKAKLERKDQWLMTGCGNQVHTILPGDIVTFAEDPSGPRAYVVLGTGSDGRLILKDVDPEPSAE